MDLRTFNVKEALAKFETEQFQYDEEAGYYLNSEEEKLWTYMYGEGETQHTVTLEILGWDGELIISYSSEKYDEHLRKKVSLISGYLKADLMKLYPDYPVILSQPIIQDLELYEQNLTNTTLNQQIEKINQIFQDNQTKPLASGEVEMRFHLHGEDGYVLGEALSLAIPMVEFAPKEDGNHLLTLHSRVVGEKEKFVGSFSGAIQSFGYSMAYIEPVAEYDKEYLLDMLNSGMIDINKNP